MKRLEREFARAFPGFGLHRRRSGHYALVSPTGELFDSLPSTGRSDVTCQLNLSRQKINRYLARRGERRAA